MADISLEMGDVTLWATVTGAGPTILLLHAGGENRGVWAPVASRMAERGLRTVALDLRGHGASSGTATKLGDIAGDVAELVVGERTPVVVVGASLGGLAAIAALAEPYVSAMVAGLVLVDVVPDPDPERVRSWLDERGLRDRYPEITEDILGRGIELLAIAGRLDMPILLVRGGVGSPLTDVEADRLCMVNPRVTVAGVSGAGHLVARDAPAELARIVSAHAAGWLGVIPD